MAYGGKGLDWAHNLRGGSSSDVADIRLGAEYFDKLLLIVLDIPFHDLHARSEKTFKCTHVQNWNRTAKLAYFYYITGYYVVVIKSPLSDAARQAKAGLIIIWSYFQSCHDKYRPINTDTMYLYVYIPKFPFLMCHRSLIICLSQN